MQQLLLKLKSHEFVSKKELIYLLQVLQKPNFYKELFKIARKTKEQYFGNKIYIRGLIEFSNYCKNNCYYCGLRKDNIELKRYRLNLNEILECCTKGYFLGFRTFVLQGGEDPYFTDKKIIEIIKNIKEKFSDCAITLSIGEKTKNSYEKYFQAGANRFLLRHESASEEHYKLLHPDTLSLANRKQCLFNLKKITYQTGSGFMVGSPFQTLENLAEDLIFLKQLAPQMVGVGPFIAQHKTKFTKFANGSSKLTLIIISLLRLMLPKSLIPSTTALASVVKKGRIQGILAGANVLMPNLSPIALRKQYTIYDNKGNLNEETAEELINLKKELKSIACKIEIGRGDYKD